MNAWPLAVPRAASTANSGLRRLVVPSYSDLFFLSLLAWLFMSTPDGWVRLLSDGDTGWHIRTGDYVLQNLAVPRTDLFSFTREGEPWFAWEWGADVIFALLHRAFGLKGIAILGGVLIGVYATLLYRYILWRGANALLALAIALLAVGASTIHYLARPHLFTLVLVPACVWIVERDRRRRWSGVWFLIPITAVWTNLHSGFLALIALLGLLAAGSALQALMTCADDRDWSDAQRYSILTAACGAASLVNPYGIQLHLHIAAYLRSDWIREAIQEFQSPSFRNENILQFELLMLAGLIACGPLLSRRAFPEALWILFWAHQALGSMRHITVFVGVAAPILAMEATRLWENFIERAHRRSVRRILDNLAADMSAGFRWTSLWPAVAVAALFAVDLPIRWPSDFPDTLFPTAMIGRHPDLMRNRRVLTTDQWADYLIYRFYPDVKVYIDGRSDFFGASLGKEYVRLSYGQYDWRKTLEARKFDTVLIPAEWSLGSLLKRDAGWRLLEDDGKTLLFVPVNVAMGVTGTKASEGNGKSRSTGLMKFTGASDVSSGVLNAVKDSKIALQVATAASAGISSGFDTAGWRLPSGLQLAEFALRGGFIAPGLMPRAGSPLSAPVQRTGFGAPETADRSQQPKPRNTRRRFAAGVAVTAKDMNEESL